MMMVMIRVAESVATLPRRGEPSKDLVSQSLSSKLTCEREMAQKALELLLTAQSSEKILHLCRDYCQTFLNILRKLETLSAS